MNFNDAIATEDTDFVAYFDNYPVYLWVGANEFYSADLTHVPAYRHSEVVLETLVWEQL